MINLILQDVSTVDPTSIIGKILEYGILGIVLILLIWKINSQDKEKKTKSIEFSKERESWKAQLEKERVEWVAERKEWNNRLQEVVNNHISDIEKHGKDRSEMINKYHEFMATINAFIKNNN